MGLIYDIRPTIVFIEELENTVRYIQYNLQNEIAAKKLQRECIKRLILFQLNDYLKLGYYSTEAYEVEDDQDV